MLIPIQLHYLIALIVFAALLMGLFTQVGRRVALWALAAQLIAGMWLIFSGLRPSPWHPALWLGAALLTQGAIFAGKRDDRRALTVGLVVLALLCAVGAYYLGLTYQR